MAGEAFHVTRIEWSRIKNPEYIASVHARGWTFQGTSNAITANSEFALTSAEGTPVRDKFDRPGRYVADPTSAQYRRWYQQELLTWVELGADSIQRDAPTAEGDWPLDNAADFFEAVHMALPGTQEGRLPVSTNLLWNNSTFGGAGATVVSHFDFSMTEIALRKLTPKGIEGIARDADGAGRALVATVGTDLGKTQYRRVIAASYANGIVFMVPWDQYNGLEHPRVFKDPRDFADLYAFVRAMSEKLDCYDRAISFGYGLAASDRGWSISPVDSRITVWIRENKADPSSPLVLHLVNWGGSGTPTITLPHSFSSCYDNIVARYVWPLPYSPERHSVAHLTGDYRQLIWNRPLPIEKNYGRVQIKPDSPEPWGIVVLGRDGCAAHDPVSEGTSSK
jgi:hypothetical protein